MPILTNTAIPTQHQVLDPCLLGRPVHLLSGFAAQLRDDLAAAMRAAPGGRYWGAFRLDSVAFGRASDAGPGRWLRFAGAAGTIGFSLERPLLLSVLNQRFARRGAAHAPAPDPDAVRVTATEERLSVVLGQQLAAVLATRVAANLALPGAARAAAAPPLELLSAGWPAKGSWTIVVGVSELNSDARGQFWFSLDQALMTSVLHGLAPQREQGQPLPRSIRPLATRLPVTLDGRLVSKEIALGALFELRVGDVIPVSMGRAEVLLDESCLFTAAVTEHKGKLCLTSFEDTE